MKSNVIKATIASLAMLPLAGLATAQAQDYTLKYDQTLLASPVGMQQVYESIEKQAKDICSPDSIRASEIVRARECQLEIVSDAIEKISDEQLTAYHETGKLPVRLTENK